MLGQLARQDKADCGLNFPRCHSGLLVVSCQGGSLDSDLLEDVSDKRVQNGHGLRRDSSVGVDLLQHLHKDLAYLASVHCRPQLANTTAQQQ